MWLRGFAAWGSGLLARALVAHLDAPAARTASMRRAIAALDAWCQSPSAAAATEVMTRIEAAESFDSHSSTGRA